MSNPIAKSDASTNLPASVKRMLEWGPDLPLAADVPENTENKSSYFSDKIKNFLGFVIEKSFYVGAGLNPYKSVAAFNTMFDNKTPSATITAECDAPYDMTNLNYIPLANFVALGFVTVENVEKDNCR